MATTLAVPVASGRGRGVRDRLVTPMPTDRLAGWLVALAVTAFGAAIRFVSLGSPGGPKGLVFDEVYYVHDSFNLLHHGVELNSLNTGPGFIVHPPMGKWVIAIGEALFSHGTFVTAGTSPAVYPGDSFGWRFSAAVVGSLAILILARTARRMFRSTVLGAVAGLLLALDGLEFVQSRVSMLDIFLTFWVVASFGCLVADRDDGRSRLAARLSDGEVGRGPWLGIRWWRLGAGMCLGLACATKWNGVFFVPAFLGLGYMWDVAARRVAGLRHPWRGALLLDGLPALAVFVVLPILVYVVSWTGWFLGNANTAYDHDLDVRAGQSTIAHAWAVFRGWWHYQDEIWRFHNHLSDGHPYRSYPLGWLLLARPVAYFYATPKNCGTSLCSQEILGIGTPAIWWLSIPAMIAAIWRWISRHDWRAAAIVVCFLFAWLPWFVPAYADQRTMFLFYALPMLPFMVLGLTLCAGLVLGSREASVRRRRWGAYAVGLYLLAVLANFGYLYPVLAGRSIPYSSWHQRMWFSQCANKDPKHETAPCWI
ncbi:MAG TPA: phospholipid carrier-dependent glycosyltransferase [Mycobacteriales bacterium]|nr:phospholipid carrier-dependent glycosyltransferase [Mycobacteriales bacterium]